MVGGSGEGSDESMAGRLLRQRALAAHAPSTGSGGPETRGASVSKHDPGKDANKLIFFENLFFNLE